MKLSEFDELIANASADFKRANTHLAAPRIKLINLDRDNMRPHIISMANFDIERLYDAYLRTGSVHRAALEFNTTGETVRQHLTRAGKRLSRTKWNDESIKYLMIAYASPDGVDLAALSRTIGRTYAAVACKADELGICSERGKQIRTLAARENYSKAQKELAKRPGVSQTRSKAVSDAFKRNGHPRGFAGKKRTPEELEKMKAGSAAAWSDPNHRVNSPEYRQNISDRSSRCANARPKENAYSRAKSGWVEVGGKRLFARSRWEANYACYLEFLKLAGDIQEWEHEPKTFWFEKIKRGVRSYLPDFRVTLNNGTIEWHEVKGWMDAKSKTKIKRMSKYYPTEILIIRDSQWFKFANKNLAIVVNGWAK